MTLTEELYHALKFYPCKCQMVGGSKWHVMANMEVAIKCARHKAMERYEREKKSITQHGIAEDDAKILGIGILTIDPIGELHRVDPSTVIFRNLEHIR